MISFPQNQQLSIEDLRDLVFRASLEYQVYGTLATRVGLVEILDQCKLYKAKHNMLALYDKEISVGNGTQFVNSIRIKLPDIQLLDNVEIDYLKRLKEPYAKWFLSLVDVAPEQSTKVIKAVREHRCQWVDFTTGFEDGVEKIVLELWNETGGYQGYKGRVAQ